MNRKRQQQELLGMSMSAAERKLRKSIIFDLAQQLHKNVCLECGQPIDDPDALAIKHVEDWEESPSRFFELTNVAFSHISCGAGEYGRGQRESAMRVAVIVENPEGTPLRGCLHQGQIYVAGQLGQQYQVRVRNLTNQRLLLVTTVDGRNVNTGKKGDWNDSGHVLGPHDQWVFTGWRTSDDQVAAFRLGAKSGSYSAQMGSPENVGVIGVAVFEEVRVSPPVTIKTVMPTLPDRATGTRLRPHGVSGSGTFSCSVGQGLERSSSDYGPEGSGLEFERRTFIPRGGAGPRTRVAQELGTEYGEALLSRVTSTTFARATSSPCEVHQIRYDSLDALVQAGIMGSKPSERKPQAFPESGYCPPPPHLKAHR